MEYHLSHDTHPSASFGIEPLFPATLLTNPTYTNVTGGQRVEMMLDNNEPAILSGFKAISRILTPDVFYGTGLIHVIDKVLTIPDSFPATITTAGLNDLVALLDAGNWLQSGSDAVRIANELPDLTIFGPNDPRFGATFTGFEGMSQETLDAIFSYSIVQGTVIYSDLLKNNTKYETLQGASIVITEANGGYYVDQARIKTRDYLCANGVLQIIDQPLDPTKTGSRPAIIPTEEAKPEKGGLSSAAAAGIGITVGVLLLGGGIIAALIIRKRKARRGRLHLAGSPTGRGNGPTPRAGFARTLARAVTRDTVELDFHGPPPRYGTHELDDKPEVYSARMGNTVVELRQSPSPTRRPSNDATSPDVVSPEDGLPHGISPGGGVSPNDVRSTSTTSRSGRPGLKSKSTTTRNSVASVGGRSLNLRGPAGSGLPPSPPNLAPRGGLQEIDGQERSRIEISITGDAPRHLGFQARY